MSTFNDIYNRAAKDLLAKVDKSFRAVCIQAGEGLIKSSVVGDPTKWKSPGPKGYVGGRFRANWQTSINRIDESVVDSRNFNLSAVTQALANVKANDVVYYSNHLPYAKRLNEGHSVQKPAGWVDDLMADFKDDFEATIRRELSTTRNYGDGK